MGELIDLVLPRSCVCGEPAVSGALCGSLCGACQRALSDGARLARPHPAPAGLPECAVGGWYEGPLRRAVISYKERGRRELSLALTTPLRRALLLLTALRAALRVGRVRIVLVPVPMSPAGWRARGFDHVALLVRRVVREFASSPITAGRVGWAPLLEHARRVGDQAGLTARARRDNLAFSLRARAPVLGRSMMGGPVVIVVDDVMTTGATLAEAARALRAAGVRTAGCAAVAGVERGDRVVDPSREGPESGRSVRAADQGLT